MRGAFSEWERGLSVVSTSESLFIWFVESAFSALSLFWGKTYLLAILTGLPLHLQKYVEQLLEHRYIVLSGEQGLGKSYLATKLAEHVVQRWEKNTKRHWVFVPRRLSKHVQECKWLYSLQSWNVCLLRFRENVLLSIKCTLHFTRGV